MSFFIIMVDLEYSCDYEMSKYKCLINDSPIDNEDFPLIM